MAPPHSVSPEHPRHTRVATLQIGVAPPHWRSLTQATQRLAVASHTGVAPVHAEALVAVHCTHAPEVASHAVVPARVEHCASLVQRPQV